MTIYHTYDETLGGSSCCEMLESVQSHLILVCKVGAGIATLLSPLMTQKQIVVTIIDIKYLSQP